MTALTVAALAAAAATRAMARPLALPTRCPAAYIRRRVSRATLRAPAAPAAVAAPAAAIRAAPAGIRVICCPPDDDNVHGTPPHSSAPGPTASKAPVSATCMPVWDVSEPYINLWLYDEPLGYQPGLGPRLSFQPGLQAAGRAPGLRQHLQRRHQLDLLVAQLRRGRRDRQPGHPHRSRAVAESFYVPPDGSAMEYYTHTTLQRQTSGGSLTGFVRSFPSGATDYYQCVPAHVRLPDGNTPVFLTARADPSGHTNVLFTYAETAGRQHLGLAAHLGDRCRWPGDQPELHQLRPLADYGRDRSLRPHRRPAIRQHRPADQRHRRRRSEQFVPVRQPELAHQPHHPLRRHHLPARG